MKKVIPARPVMALRPLAAQLREFWRRYVFSRRERAERTVYKIFCLKIKVKKRWILSRRLFALHLAERGVPLVYQDNFYTLKSFPVESAGCLLKSDPFALPGPTAVIMQGNLLLENNFTYETLKLYKDIFNNGERLILSSWEGEDPACLDKISALGVEVTLSGPPETPGRANVNYQIKSTLAGLGTARRLGCVYALKTRTDQRFYAKNISRFLFGLQRLFPLPTGSPLHARLVATSFNSFMYRLYGVSDMFMFGHLDSLEKYFNAPFDNVDKKCLSGLSQVEILRRHCPETLLGANFLKNIGIQPDYSPQQSLEFLRDCLVFADKEELGLYWPKYTNMDSRWNFYRPNLLEEIRFKDWLALYQGSMDIACLAQKSFDSAPDIGAEK